MKWKYVKALKSINLIEEFERLVNYSFDESFIRCVKKNNGGRPQKRTFITIKNKEREIKTFLSFNHGDKESVWDIYNWNKEELADRYIPFAIDNFGNIICFNHDGNVVFINHEDLSVEFVAVSFDCFLDLLY